MDKIWVAVLSVTVVAILALIIGYYYIKNKDEKAESEDEDESNSCSESAENEDQVERTVRANTELLKISDSEKSKMFICILMLSVLCGCMLFNVPSFYPLYV